jgi:hypothetical protein
MMRATVASRQGRKDMPATSQPYLIRLEALASAAGVRELEFRTSVAAETARLERERQFAYRRLDLLRTLAGAAASAATPEQARSHALAALQRELGWNTETEARKMVLAAIAPVLEAMRREGEPGGEAGPSVEEVMAEFEAWYAASFGSPFLAHFDVELPELPVVEF